MKLTAHLSLVGSSAATWVSILPGNSRSSLGIWIQSREEWKTSWTPRHFRCGGKSIWKDLFSKSCKILYGPMNLGSSFWASPLGKEMFLEER